MGVTSNIDSLTFSPTRNAELIGNMLIGLGKINSGDIKVIASHQLKNKTPFGESAIELGLISQDDLLQVLAKQFEYPCQIDNGTAKYSQLVTMCDPFGVQAERYRALRSSVIHKAFTSGKKHLAVVPVTDTSSAAEVATNLAISFAQTGMRTLLVDADMRSPTLHTLLHASASPGLSDVLIGRIAIKNAIQNIDEAPSLTLLSAGHAPPNPQELLLQPIYRRFLESVSEGYDVIVFATPAASHCADAAIVATLAQNTILTIKKDIDSVKQTTEARRVLAECNASVLGAVLCN